MVHDAVDVPAGPASLALVRVRFDEQRLVSDAGLLLCATLAERLEIEELVNESVCLDPRAPGAALPGRKVMSLVHGMLVGADSIDDMNVLRAWVDRADSRSQGDGPLDTGDVFAGVHVRVCPPARPGLGPVARSRVGDGRGTGRAAVGDRYRQLYR
jgi:hypothetical protein